MKRLAFIVLSLIFILQQLPSDLNDNRYLTMGPKAVKTYITAATGQNTVVIPGDNKRAKPNRTADKQSSYIFHIVSTDIYTIKESIYETPLIDKRRVIWRVITQNLNGSKYRDGHLIII